jgi:hypothetical protein
MTADEFRSLALSFAGAIESAHMGHPDFRVKGKIFATLHYPARESGMIKLTPAKQKELMAKAPKIFSPCAGAWGRGGATKVDLPVAKAKMIAGALEFAWRNVGGG